MGAPRPLGRPRSAIQVGDPRDIPDLAATLTRLAPGLMWALALVERWGELDAASARRWRFYLLPGAGQGRGEGTGGDPDGREDEAAGEGRARGILFGDPGGYNWWGIGADDVEGAQALAAAAPELQGARSLTGTPEVLRALRSAHPRLGGAWRERESLALHRGRRAGEGEGDPPPGFGRASAGDISELMTLEPGLPGEDPRVVSRVLRVRAGRGEVFVQREGGRIVGMGEALFAGGVRDVQRVVICPSFQGRGLGRRLMEGILWAGGRSGHDLTLCVETDNAVALILYVRLGFEVQWLRGDWTRP